MSTKGTLLVTPSVLMDGTVEPNTDAADVLNCVVTNFEGDDTIPATVTIDANRMVGLPDYRLMVVGASETDQDKHTYIFTK